MLGHRRAGQGVLTDLTYPTSMQGVGEEEALGPTSSTSYAAQYAGGRGGGGERGGGQQIWRGLWIKHLDILVPPRSQ